ncbi:hypothetical protein TNIN_493251 [Trichonephila inaurata madagascariensis]|nr:hypothetical protein TNIN_493251 [Trichonephila inaurata madagascariensis]
MKNILSLAAPNGSRSKVLPQKANDTRELILPQDFSGTKSYKMEPWNASTSQPSGENKDEKTPRIDLLI